MNNLPSFLPDTAIPEGQPTILFNIGGYEMHLYSLMLMFGFLFSILTVFFFWMKEKWDLNILFVVIIITVPSGIIGGRLGFIIERLIYSPANPFPNSHWYAIWEGGLSIQGGVILAALLDTAYLYTRRQYVDLRKCFSYILPAVLVGQFVGRFGNYANHEVYGRIDWSGSSVLSLGETFARNMYISDDTTAALGLTGAYRYPLFLYEGLANLIGYIVICWIINYFGLLKPGTSGGLYLLWYGVTRAAMEPLREESYGLYSYVAIIFIVLGVSWILYFQFFCSVKYIRTLEKYRFTYQYKEPEQYQNYVYRSSLKHLLAWFKTKEIKA
ncbi:prolipoprotein diacylglyceryl transferase [Mycoplasmopsis verecunda]|uniref:Phosphatidylglycerol--prolipoprotein diacylglyceryl transferase n=2 Tax=Mycoplasmopsis verecunda TaxID=171291 RepID=A0A1T4KS59_9BACT|nr:prolipoprotein diacylglyceryl transferase [Mycoplasmopsis verecunda]SJZ45251.1 phosphatidylglycerol:prolipoprotein diacylglycerol transferase [Mycoplasmopsis verecunda]